jgi:OOP family OmpA-OmpF porin
MSFPRLLAALSIAAALVGATSCGESAGPSGSTVSVDDNLFSPETLTVAAGTTVTWNWDGNANHNVTWEGQGAPAPSPTQSSGSYTRTFSAAGTYDYYCSVHGAAVMSGSVVVQ